MKNVLAVTAIGASIGLVMPAAAADMAARPYVKALAYAEPIYTWTGFYVGAHVGYAWGDEHDNLSQIVGIRADKFPVDGVIGGVHAGYNWQSDRFVFGLEGDFSGSDIKGSKSFDDLNGVIKSTGVLSFKSDWQASLRGRIGIAERNWLFYFTGGVAFADVTSSLDISRYNISVCEGICVAPALFGSSASNVLTGYTVGIGTEYAFTRSWIARAEVRYTDFGAKTFDHTDGFGYVIPTRVRFDQVHALAGISYKF